MKRPDLTRPRRWLRGNRSEVLVWAFILGWWAIAVGLIVALLGFVAQVLS